jgi:hypothetical protein
MPNLGEHPLDQMMAVQQAVGDLLAFLSQRNLSFAHVYQPAARAAVAMVTAGMTV